MRASYNPFLSSYQNDLLKVIDTLDFTEEWIDGKDVFNFWRDNKSVFINVDERGAILNYVISEFSIKDGSVSFFSKRDGINGISVKYKGKEYWYFRLLSFPVVVFDEYNKKKGYSAKAIYGLCDASFSLNASAKTVYGLSQDSFLLFPNSLIVDNGLDFTTEDDITIRINKNRVYVMSEYASRELNCYFRESLYSLIAENQPEKTWGSLKSLVKDLEMLTKYYSLEKDIAKRWLDYIINSLLDISPSNYESEVMESIMSLVDKYYIKREKARIAKKMFLGKE